MSPAHPRFRLTLAAHPENIALIRHALAGLAAELGASNELIDDIKTAASEAATNAILHAYSDPNEGPIEVSTNVIGGRLLEIVIRDRGIGMQPRPVTPDEPSLRVGLALIGALSDGFEIRGEEGEGTEVRIRFDLDRETRTTTNENGVRELAGDEETHISVQGPDPGGAAIPKVLELVAARSNLSLDRLSDTQLLGDFLAHWTSRATVDAQPLEVTIKEAHGSVDVRIGPLEPGLAKKMLERSTLPGLGTTLEALAGNVSIEEAERAGERCEFLTLEVRD